MDVKRSWLKAASKKGADSNQDRAKNHNAEFRVKIDRLLKQDLSFRDIAKHFNETIGPNRRGKPWITQTVHRLYKRMGFDEAYDIVHTAPKQPSILRQRALNRRRSEAKS